VGGPSDWIYQGWGVSGFMPRTRASREALPDNILDSRLRENDGAVSKNSPSLEIYGPELLRGNDARHLKKLNAYSYL
jgi:hypothetical protein